MEENETTTVPEAEQIDLKERHKLVAKACRGDAELFVKAVDEDWAPERVELELYRQENRRAPRSTSFGSRSSGRVDADSMTAAMLMRAGFGHVAEKSYAEPVLTAAHDLSRMSIVDMCRAELAARGELRSAMSNVDVIKASGAMSTGAMPTALGGSMEKLAAESFRSTPATWRSFARIRSTSNFRENTAIRAVFSDDLLKLGEGGEIQHGDFTESTFTFRASTWARMFTIARDSLVNDDLGFFTDLPVSLGQAAARKLNDEVWKAIMAGEDTSFFSAAHANLIDDALDITGLSAGVAAMRRQTDSLDRPIDISPAVLVVPPALETTAKELINSLEISRISTGDELPTGNPFANSLRIEVEPRLESTTLNAGATTAIWYMFAPPSSDPVTIGFLNGRQTPTIESEDADFGVLGYSWRAYIDFGVALSTYQAALKSSGTT